MKRRLLIWCVVAAILSALAMGARYSADLSAFLPAAPTPAQQLLVDQLKYGPVSRILMLAIEGGPDGPTRAKLSNELSTRLRGSDRFASVHNGAAGPGDEEREILFRYRYLLGNAVDAGRLDAQMRPAIQNSLQELASPLGLALKDLLVRDPTGETMRLVDLISGDGGPVTRDGVWTSPNGGRALILVHLKDDGTSIDAQQAALRTIDRQFAALDAKDARLLVSGTARFSVDSRDRIERDVSRLSGLGLGLIALLLLWVFRSPKRLLLSLLPVGTGILAGIAACSLAFGDVHGITLGFGVALIGEAIDYVIYLHVQGARPRLWRTIALGLLTSLIGFSALLLSGFPGLAQLGLFAMTGLVSAFFVSRWLLTPWVGDEPIDLPSAALGLPRIVAGMRRFAAVPVIVGLAAAGMIAWQSSQAPLWKNSIDALSPVPESDKELDAQLRSDLRAPDLRYVIGIAANNQDQALERAARVGLLLDRLVAGGVLSGYDSPARVLPDETVQRHRRDALPANAAALRDRVRKAVAGLPLRAERLEPFIEDVLASRKLEPLTAEDLRNSSLELAVDSMLVPGNGYVTAILPLHAPQVEGRAADLDAARIRLELGLSAARDGRPDARNDALRAAIQNIPSGSLNLIDIKGEGDSLYASYVEEARWLSLAGAVLITLLLIGTRWQRFFRIVVPLAAAVATIFAALGLAKVDLTLLHLVGFLLVVAIGSNYALFFADDGQEVNARVLFSLLLASVTTTIGFGVLAFASVPVLSAIGVTVGPGSVLCLLFSTMMSRPAAAPGPEAAR